MPAKYTIALSKGELAAETQNFIRQNGCFAKILNKPVLAQYYGDVCYRIVRPGDAARLVGCDFDYAITGKDRVKEAGNPRAKILEELPFGRGRIVAYTRKGWGYGPDDKPVFVTADYPRLADAAATQMKFENADIRPVDGADEGFVSCGKADIGIGFVCTGDTLRRNGLEECFEIMKTCAVIIADSRPELTLENFYRLLVNEPPI